MKAVKIDGAEATAENIKNDSYKVSRPFNIATKKGLDNEVAKDFINFIMSKDVYKRQDVYRRWIKGDAACHIFCGTDRYCDWFSGGNSPLDI